MPFDRFWSPSEPIPSVPPDSHEPALAPIADTVHLVWSSNRVLYHAFRASGVWSHPLKLAVGEQPTLAATPEGRLHCLFTNQFAGNYEIYHVAWDETRWTLPQPVSGTTGASANPALAVGPDGSLHAVWSDTTPGYSVIYHGHLEGVFWSSVPISNGRGSMPALAITPDGDVFVAWQDRVVQNGCYDVFCATMHAGDWSLPEIVSDSRDLHSLQPRLATNSQGGCHLIWQEQRDGIYVICHSEWYPKGWSVPVDVSTGLNDCRQPRIVANPQGFLQVIWLEGNALHHRVRPPEHNATWWVPQTAGGDYQDLSDLTVAMDRNGELHVVWSGLKDSDMRLLYYASRQPIFKPASGSLNG